MQKGQLISESDRDMLRSILVKDNERIKDEIREAKSEVVFQVGFEGGGLEVTRYITRLGKMYFRASGTNMRLDENDDEEWVSWEDEPVASFNGALAELRFGIDLLCIVPILIHPDYREAVRNHVELLSTQVTSEHRKRMGESLERGTDRWFRVLNEPS